ncbi:MAG TPA: serine/threonine-protein kinase [Byssovorax sp.]|jgi:serine/threonine-protein kinase
MTGRSSPRDLPDGPLSADRLTGARLGGRYLVGAKLGEGGVGAVFAATDERDHADVALKVLLDDTAREAAIVTRFFQESRASAALASSHVTRTLDAGVDEALGVPFLVMERLVGSDLAATIRRAAPLPASVALRVAAQAARGLVAAHAGGIVHRDVKPENLFLTETDGLVCVKVCDFGIAKVHGAAGVMTQTGALMGSPLYMSPEQTKSSKHVDGRTDVWSLGVTLYEMLAGRTPIDGALPVARILLAIAAGDVLPLQEAAPWVDPRVAELVHEALIQDVDARCPSMLALLERVAALLDVDPDAADAFTVRAAEVAAVDAGARTLEAPRAPVPTFARGSLVAERQLVAAQVGATIGGYKLLQILGRGGMGAVYEAEADDGARYALKLIRDDASSRSTDARRRFVREARASAALDDPHVVRVVAADTDAATGAPYIVMELLRGRDLDSLLSSLPRPLEPEVVARVFSQAARGLAAAHARGVIHRDVKPANLFLHDADGAITVKICDFGVAKRIDGTLDESSSMDLTRTGGILGSPLYMSPEQAKNAKNVGAASDLWSLCLAMYQALSGARPWPSCTSVGELIVAICTEELPRLEEIAPWVEPALADVVHRGLVRDPSKRWSAAADLVAALAPHRGGSEALTPDDLGRAIAVDVAARPARLAESASSQREPVSVTAATLAGPAADAPSPRRGVRALVAAGVVAVIGVGGAMALGSRSPARGDDRPATTAPAASTAASASPAPAASAPAPTGSSTAAAAPRASTAARVAVHPDSAAVTVDGAPRELEGGALVLRGEPGDSFKVVASAAGAKIERVVVLDRHGAPTPSELIVPAASHGGPVRVAPPPSAPARAASPAAPAATGPAFQKSW